MTATVAATVAATALQLLLQLHQGLGEEIDKLFHP